ncbi:diacylglycerol O-acyltransferase [Virgisporangium aliadipatigenens]|uniref:Diacylglycerol O-acyltransferase n=1 Tax=Virgisporangium aliadipatigenens TaxID=741659 RepID=A0A8J3YMA9_9ACTN|nr:wax ester/triacylglycerol synthase family O-acyltransferase [Virgisporangium aliadipatigenens]GIJ48134.1 diacylglycerol O-acyltransferase [Virgisporangium aliadipatigenens]
MDELSVLDATFLDAEDEDAHLSMAIASVAVIDGPAPAHAEFQAAIAGRLPLIPRYRQVVRRVPFDLGPPVWVDVEGVDLDFHVRRTALPAGATEEDLCRVVARIMSHRLDRSRPLWEYWVIEGLPEGRWALLSKVHHCMVDGVSGNELYRLLFDATPEPRDAVADAQRPCPAPTTFRLTADALVRLARMPADQVRLVGRALRAPGVLARRAGETALGLGTLAAGMWPGTPTSLGGPVGTSRRWAVSRVPLADVVAVAKAHGVTVNDVVLAAVTGAFRRLMLARGEAPVPGSIRTLVPVNVRAGSEAGILDNRISVLLPSLPVEFVDPLNRLHSVHQRVMRLKRGKESEAHASMTALARYEPFAPIAMGVRMVLRLRQRSVVTVVTNVPGPRQRLYALGRPVREILPYVPIGNGLRTGVSVFTFGGQAVFGITTDFDSVPEIGLFTAALADEVRALVDTVPKPPRKRATAQERPGPGVSVSRRRASA